jgi:hypothetical protein
MHQPGKGRFWRKLAAVLAAYVIALQAILSGLGAAALAASSDTAALPICSEHAADPAGNASPPAGDPWLCPCAPACMTAGSTLLSDAPAVMAFTPAAALPAALPKWHDDAIPPIGVRGPQIPRAPPTI